jgi:Tol biopolymer transport system component/DNA-binding winged helix-turn-helix (wHTH) protein
MPPRECSSYQFDGFTVDLARRMLLRENRPVHLKPKAFDLLVVLVESRGRVVTKEELLKQVWPNQFVEQGNLTVHISALRKALGERMGQPRYLVTIPGSGYRFVPLVGGPREPAETKEGLVIEQHTLSRVVVEDEDVQGEKAIKEVIEGLAGNSRSQTAGPNAQAAPAHVGPQAALQPRTITPVLAQKRGPGVKALMVGGAFLALIAGCALGYRLLSKRQNQQQAVDQAGGVGRMTIKQLTAIGNVGSATISPDGKYFVYEMHQEVYQKHAIESLWFGHVNGGNPVQLRSEENVIYGCLSFAPDGDSIFYQKNGGLFQMPVLGGAPQKVLDRVPSTFALSPDGKRVGFVRDDGDRKVSAIVIANLDGSGEHELVTLPAGKGFSGYGPAWSPDGRELAIGAASQTNPNQQVLISVQVGDGKMRQLNSQAWDQISTVAWTSDGKGIVFHGRGPESDFHIWLLDYPQGGLRCITPDPSRYGRDSVSLSRDGNSLVAVRGEGDCHVWIGPADGIDQSRQITKGWLGKEDGAFGLAWMPDGKIVYVSSFNNSSSLWVMNADGSLPKQITPAGSTDRYPRVTADGRYVVFQSNRGGSTEVWRVNPDGSDMRRLTTGGNNTNPEPTRDGKWVLYGSIIEGTGTMWKVSIGGGEPERVIPDIPADCPKVSPDGKLLACAYYDRAVSPRQQLAVLSLDDFRLVYHFDLARFGTFSNGLHWTADGSAVTYRNFAGGVWRQPLTGGAAEKLASVPDRRIYYYDWSHDGKQFAMAYGDEIRDAVLINNFR